MRYRVFVEQMYPLAASDMRMLDNRVSTTWCQKQIIKVNATFNAFLLPTNPEVEKDKKHLTMVRHLMLEDDTKEYWGFYFLKGSSVTISSCVRWPGASLIVIRGHKHLHECAYIGDNSSEELDEIMEAIAEGNYVQQNNIVSEEAPSNVPNLMKRHRQDVQFHHPDHKNSSSKNHTIFDGLDTTDITDQNQLKDILKELAVKTNKKDKFLQDDVKRNHVHRNSTFGKGETKNFKFEKEKETADEVYKDVLVKLKDLGEEGEAVLKRLNEKYRKLDDSESFDSEDEHILNVRGRQYSKPPVKYEDSIDRAKRRKRDLLREVMEKSFSGHDEENDAAIEEGFTPDGIADHRGKIDENTLNDKSNSEFWSSFSSSEEALLNCAGLILNLPLEPHKGCMNTSNHLEIEDAYLANTITYTVPVNGYYFFVFNSENEIQTNYIRVRFNLHKKVYNVSNPISACKNTSDVCSMNLNFFSSEKLVMELPVTENDDMWNQEYVVVSQCEPRTMIYIIFVIAIPILIILFAFQ
ncbi:uncharacterized protein [Onthophagus taurus]